MDNKALAAQAKERVIESFANNMHLYGVTPSIGRIYGALYFQNEPMTLDELKEELGMSKTSMSTGVRVLIDLNLVEKVWKKGARKDLFQVRGDLFQNFIELFSTHWRKGIQLNLEALFLSLEELEDLSADENNEDTAKEARKVMEKIQYAIDYYEWLNQVIDLFESKEVFTIIKKN